MNSSYMPPKQADQVVWCGTFNTVVGANPNPYGLSDTDMDNFADLNTEVQAAWTAYNVAPEERTGNLVARKNQALKAMREGAKYLVRKIQGTSTVTDAMKTAAGVTVYKTSRTPSQAPDASPFVTASANGRSVTVELFKTAGKKGRPDKVTGATVFYATGPTPPPSADGWTFATNTNKDQVEIDMPASDEVQTVWVTAFWRNSVSESGPAATPVSIQLLPGGTLPTEMGKDEIRLAA